MIPVVGPVISNVLTGILSFGLMCVASEIKKTGKVNFKILFAGFDSGVFQRLYSLIFIWILSGMLQGLLIFIVRGVPYGAFIAIFVSLTISILVISFIVFAPALVIWYDLPTLEAINLNFVAAKRNVMPLIVYTLAPLVILAVPLFVITSIIGFLPEMLAAGLGILVVLVLFAAFIIFVPAMVASLYFLFEAIFLSEPFSEAPPGQHQPPQQSEPQQ